METDLKFRPFRSPADPGWDEAWAIYQNSFPQKEIRSLEERFTYLSTRPVMVSLSDKAEHIREREQRKALAKIGHLTEEEEKIIDHMTHMIVRKLLREPMIRLNTAAGTVHEIAEKEAMERIFRLEIREAANDK